MSSLSLWITWGTAFSLQETQDTKPEQLSPGPDWTWVSRRGQWKLVFFDTHTRNFFFFLREMVEHCFHFLLLHFALSRPQVGLNRRTHNEHRSQYIERLNSVYGEIWVDTLYKWQSNKRHGPSIQEKDDIWQDLHFSFWSQALRGGQLGHWRLRLSKRNALKEVLSL